MFNGILQNIFWSWAISFFSKSKGRALDKLRVAFKYFTYITLCLWCLANVSKISECFGFYKLLSPRVLIKKLLLQPADWNSILLINSIQVVTRKGSHFGNFCVIVLTEGDPLFQIWFTSNNFANYTTGVMIYSCKLSSFNSFMAEVPTMIWLWSSVMKYNQES